MPFLLSMSPLQIWRNRQSRGSWVDVSVWNGVTLSVPPEDISSDSDDNVEEGVAPTIRSPIRVSPERSDRRSRDRKGRHDRDRDKESSKTLSVKDRLFVSKKTILGEYSGCGLE